MRSLSVSPSTLEDDVGMPGVLAGVDDVDDVRVCELGDGPRLTAEALELVGVLGELPVHQLDGDMALEHRVGRPVHRRHPPGADLGFEAIAPVELHPDERGHGFARIVPHVGEVSATCFTDPYCPWAWAVEPHLRRLAVEFGDQVTATFVIAGLAARFGDTRARAVACVEAAEASGMPIDPRIYLEHPPSSSHPAGLAVAAVSEQADPAPYLRRLREAILLERRRMDNGPALLEAAREVGGLDLDRLRIDFGSNAIVEAFGAHLERARAVDPTHHEPGTGRVRLPSIEFTGSDGAVHGVYGYAPYDSWQAAAIAAGAVAGEVRPSVEEAVRQFGPLATAEVAAACDMAGPRAPAELWRLALEWRLTPRRVPGGELWRAS